MFFLFLFFYLNTGDFLSPKLSFMRSLYHLEEMHFFLRFFNFRYIFCIMYTNKHYHSPLTHTSKQTNTVISYTSITLNTQSRIHTTVHIKSSLFFFINLVLKGERKRKQCQHLSCIRLLRFGQS